MLAKESADHVRLTWTWVDRHRRQSSGPHRPRDADQPQLAPRSVVGELSRQPSYPSLVFQLSTRRPAWQVRPTSRPETRAEFLDPLFSGRSDIFDARCAVRFTGTSVSPSKTGPRYLESHPICLRTGGYRPSWQRRRNSTTPGHRVDVFSLEQGGPYRQHAAPEQP